MFIRDIHFHFYFDVFHFGISTCSSHCGFPQATYSTSSTTRITSSFHMTQQSHCWGYTPRKPELKETCTSMFIAALFTIARTWKQPRCPLADEWIRKLWHIYMMEYYSDIKNNALESVLMRWMKLEPIIQSEVSQKEKHQYSILTHIYGI